VNLSDAQRRMQELLGPLDGAQIPGGCDTCDAYQTIEPMSAGIWTVTVVHDDDCPTLARIEAKRGA